MVRSARHQETPFGPFSIKALTLVHQLPSYATSLGAGEPLYLARKIHLKGLFLRLQTLGGYFQVFCSRWI